MHRDPLITSIAILAQASQDSRLPKRDNRMQDVG